MKFKNQITVLPVVPDGSGKLPREIQLRCTAGSGPDPGGQWSGVSSLKQLFGHGVYPPDTLDAAMVLFSRAVEKAPWRHYFAFYFRLIRENNGTCDNEPPMEATA